MSTPTSTSLAEHRREHRATTTDAVRVAGLTKTFGARKNQVVALSEVDLERPGRASSSP